jgi:hypothetical protein
VIESERTLQGKTRIEQRFYIRSLAPDALKISHAVGSHWAVENRLHWTGMVSSLMTRGAPAPGMLPQPRYLQAPYDASHPPRPRQTQGRTQGPTSDCRDLR